MTYPKCPKCSYPYSDGGPYLGIYDPTKSCDGCGWDAPTGKYATAFAVGVRQLLDAWRERRRR